MATRKFKELRDRMSPSRRAEADRYYQEMIAAMPLGQLRRARAVTQEELADAMGNRQAAISKIERRTDVHVSTLRDFIEALGGRLEVLAVFPDGPVRITQFSSGDGKASK